ncbi:hypothetical protein [Halobaculum rubrum]|uniref:hypothetical protein n=1 Tax=Halobaculum rubrum TaxID=2872158 RepID=UPI001CA46B8C|nr:hypothetical protein [Halobaculum rubrum]QZX99823.1 hypothetical protein K6T25_01555 [Halobaculum rubrum]QZX99860.1 hypothetical protein K6T25_01750 [Halobaculum rubrum]
MNKSDLQRLADELDRRADQHALCANNPLNPASSLLADVRADAFGEAAELAREMDDENGENRDDRSQCEICGGDVEDPHITNDGHPEGPNLWACAACASEEPGVNPDMDDEADGGETA